MHKKNEWYIVDDIEKFVESTRVLVYDAFGHENKTSLDELTVILSELDNEEIDEINQVLSQSESMIIAKKFLRKQLHKTTGKERFLIRDKEFMEMIESLNARMISNLLNSLSNRGLIQSAYDSEINDFIFWIEDEKAQNEKPETD